MPHPCMPDHPCDHCYICDVMGVCCGSLSAEQRARLEAAAQQSDDDLRAAVRLDAGTVPNLGALVRLDAASQHPARQLGAGVSSSPALVLLPVAATTPSIDSRNEAAHVVVPRPIR